METTKSIKETIDRMSTLNSFFVNFNTLGFSFKRALTIKTILRKIIPQKAMIGKVPGFKPVWLSGKFNASFRKNKDNKIKIIPITISAFFKKLPPFKPPL